MRSALTFLTRATLAFAFIFASAITTRAQEKGTTGGGQAFSSESVTAAFLIHFLRFTEWPTSPSEGDAYVIAVAGNRELEEELLRLSARQQVRDRPIRVVRLRGPLDLADAHLIYIEGVVQRVADIVYPEADAITAVRGRPVLTVGNGVNFIAHGGMARFYREGVNLRFEISAERAAAAGLVINSRLQALSRPQSPNPAAPPASER